jgi:hypothetical protein
VQLALGDIDPEIRGQLWHQAVWELSASSRLIDSEPRLFADVEISDRTASWTLTDAGKNLFAALGVERSTDVAHLKEAIVAGMKPTGLFADPKALVDTIHEAGGGAFVLIRHFLWPQALAFAAATPELMPAQQAAWTDVSTIIELDAKGGVLRARGTGPK